MWLPARKTRDLRRHIKCTSRRWLLKEFLCKICGAATEESGAKIGKWKQRPFHLRRCPKCGYAFISDPLADYDEIYSPEYYAGHGADPLLDYIYELEYPAKSIRMYEWRGIRTAVSSLCKVGPNTNWLDFGCGNGGLVRYCRDACRIVGFEKAGWIRDQSTKHGIPVLTEVELEPLSGTFDIVTAIEVLEHVGEPVEFLRTIRGLLRPGGLFFCTTGNPAPHRSNLIEWPYVLPETHISFYEPETLSRALRTAGFRPEYRGYLPGYTDIMRFKTLKNLMRFRLLENLHPFKRAAWHEVIPWELTGRILDRKLKILAHPIAWAE